ncbi:MAG: helix-turn-helix domain-containing protein [Thermaerobacter sp.]|nr:helix-turn-helix domain-containing protein [Thermaerobacter sp.]
MLYDVMCPRYEQAAQLLGKKWTNLILRVLMGRPRRFGEFRHQVPELSERLLSERLRELEDEGLVRRIVADCRPVLILYELTPKGHELEIVVQSIQAWADRWICIEDGYAVKARTR